MYLHAAASALWRMRLYLVHTHWSRHTGHAYVQARYELFGTSLAELLHLLACELRVLVDHAQVWANVFIECAGSPVVCLRRKPRTTVSICNRGQRVRS